MSSLVIWLSGLPLWQTASIIVVMPTVLVMAMTLMVRKVVGLDRLEVNNEVADLTALTTLSDGRRDRLE